MRLRRTAALLGAVTTPLCWLATATGPAQASVPDASGTLQTITVGDASEAWYAASPIDICTTPLGCAPSQVPTSPYPADTLHVGVAGGQESARTYLLPDLASLPFDATLVGGQMTLPVASGTGDGTVAADSASIRACLATKPILDGAQGSTSAPPGVDCAVGAALSYHAGDSTFTLDLQPFVTAWAGGAPQLGIALIPKSTGPTDAWHVAFNGRKRAGGGHISSSILVRTPPPTDPSTVTPGVPNVPAMPAPAAVLPVPSSGVPAAPAPVVAPTQQQPQQLQAQPVALARRFQYPLAFLLPLALLAAAVFFGRLFTRDAVPLRARA